MMMINISFLYLEEKVPSVQPPPQGLLLDNFQNGEKGPGDEVALSRVSNCSAAALKYRLKFH